MREQVGQSNRITSMWKYVTSSLRSLNEMTPEYAKWHTFGEKAVQEALRHMREKEGWEIYLVREAKASDSRNLRSEHFDTMFVTAVVREAIPALDENHRRISIFRNVDTNRLCAFVHAGDTVHYDYLFTLCFLRNHPEFTERYSDEALRTPVIETARSFPNILGRWGPPAVDFKNGFRRPLNKSALEIVGDLQRHEALMVQYPDERHNQKLGVPKAGEGDFLVNLRWWNILDELKKSDPTQ